MKKLFGILAVSAFLFASCGGNNTEAEAVDTVATEEAVVEEVVEEVADTMAADTTVAEVAAEETVAAA